MALTGASPITAHHIPLLSLRGPQARGNPDTVGECSEHFSFAGKTRATSDGDLPFQPPLLDCRNFARLAMTKRRGSGQLHVGSHRYLRYADTVDRFIFGYAKAGWRQWKHTAVRCGWERNRNEGTLPYDHSFSADRRAHADRCKSADLVMTNEFSGAMKQPDLWSSSVFVYC